MKKILFWLSLIILYVQLAQAQVAEISFLEKGKEWVYEGSPTSGITFHNHYFLSGDTIIDGQRWMRLFSEKKNVYYGNIVEEKSYEGALIEDGSKIWFVHNQCTDRVLLYDFSLKSGDQVRIPNFDDIREQMIVTVTNVYKVMIGEKELKVQQFSCDYPTKDYGGLWVEGVGGLLMLVPLSSSNGFGLCPLQYVTVEGEKMDIARALCEQRRNNMMRYEPMLSKGHHWRYLHHHFEDGNDEQGTKETVFDLDYFIDGDTLLDGKQWKKMYCETNGSRSYTGAWLEENAKVYKVAKGDDVEKAETMFEFDLLPYEYSHQYGSDQAFFSYVDTIDVGGKLYLRHNFLSCLMRDRWYYVEGIGGMEGLYPFPLDLPTCICDYSEFVGVYDAEGKCIFTSQDFQKEKYTADIEDVEKEVTQKTAKQIDNAIYNLQGRRVANSSEFQGSNNLPKGVYIQNGKKFVVK
ncbi:MAG: T9SS type A sorting domain-containing protein [Bacteroidaceae bacterium]|nr:T9SS type A sorting domain-containing protein [Bacteroidaceae bacterium]